MSKKMVILSEDLPQGTSKIRGSKIFNKYQKLKLAVNRNCACD